jgi:integrase
MVAAEVPVRRQGKAAIPWRLSRRESERRPRPPDASRKLLADGMDPSENRKAMKSARADRAANSFEVVAREWFAKYSPIWAANHGDRIIRRFRSDIFPWIGGRPTADVTAPELLAVVRRIENRGALETAHRALGNCGQVFRYAVATGRAMRDPCGDLRGALPPVKGEHFAATTDPKRVAELLRAMDGYEALTVRCALRLAPRAFVRPGELRKAEWADIDLHAAEWRYTVTKTSTPHIVPLGRPWTSCANCIP